MITGVIMAFFPLGGVISSIIQGKYISQIGKLRAIQLNSYISCLGMIFFAIAFYLNSEGWFIGMSCLGRSLQGGSIGGI